MSDPSQPELSWRVSSSTTMGFIGSMAKAFLFGCSSTEVHGLDKFLDLLDSRKDVDQRQRGLITGMFVPCIEIDFILSG